ncbi:MAG: hypothetical protein K8S00_05035 [Bacteroidales bacterium]|nr:hypothetical protein [Bacteroidales bacterium]
MFKEYINQGIALVDKKDIELKEELEKIDAEDTSTYDFEIYLNEKGSYENHYLKHTFLKSGLIYLFSQLEASLDSISNRSAFLYKVDNKEVSRIKNTQIRNHDVLSKLKFQIKSFSSFDISKNNNWPKLKDLQQIRNCVAHRDSKVSLDNSSSEEKKLDDKLLEIINRHNGLTYHEFSDTLLIEKGFLINFSDITYQFIDETIKKIWDSKKHRGY